MRELLSCILGTIGYTVISAPHGEAGYAMAKYMQPDPIISDIAMPKMNGIQMMKLIREDSDLREIPVLVMTAFGESPIKQALDADAFLEKPLDFDKLLSRIDSMLK